MIINGFRFRVGMILALGLIWTSAAVGDGPLFPGAQYAAGDAPYSVAIGDLNGDQVPDLAVAIWSSDTVSVLLGAGDGTFADAVSYAAGDGPWSVAIGDLDGDQVPDLAVANYWSDNASVLLGVGDGTFGAAVNYAAGDGPWSVAIGDLDGDQAPDLAVANWGGDRVSVLLHQLPELFDCNGNGILDTCDIDCGPAAGPCDLPGCEQSEDCNGNGVPDECEPGGHNCCNGSHGAGCNNPAVEACVCAIDPYCCEVHWDRICVEEVVTLGCGTCAGDCNGNGILDECDAEYSDIGLFVGQLLAQSPDPVLVCMFDQNGDATLDGADMQGFVDRLVSP